ncbi:MAG: hypothetical protein WCT04_23120 [Planctomycetota bacterium]
MDTQGKTGGRIPLGQILLERGLITKDQLEQALRSQVGGIRRLGNILIRMKVLDSEKLTEALAHQLKLPIVNVGDEFRNEVKSVLPRFLCRKYSVIPLSRESHNVLRLAMADPMDSVAMNDIENYTGCSVQPVLARLNDIEQAIPKKVSFSRQDLFNPQVYYSVARVLGAVTIVLLLINGFLVARNMYTDRYGTESKVGDSIIYSNHGLTIDVDGKKGSVFFSGHGAFADGSYGIRFENSQRFAEFVKVSQRQFSPAQSEWAAWVLKEKLDVAP